mgnify:CR=1 FL=1
MLARATGISVGASSVLGASVSIVFWRRDKEELLKQGDSGECRKVEERIRRLWNLLPPEYRAHLLERVSA